MTEYHKNQAEKRYAIENFICAITGQYATQLAHRIPRTKLNLRLYGEKIINHNINLVPVYDLECNSKYNLGITSDNKVTKLIKLIKEDSILTVSEIDRLLEHSDE